ncbi:uncharacterized protein [Hetaerina americana]|uniref:uncharacterized protein n=1 Tax=Hetaerina americana TaxID=62018 RepID=UPI003A7F1B76
MSGAHSAYAGTTSPPTPEGGGPTATSPIKGASHLPPGSGAITMAATTTTVSGASVDDDGESTPVFDTFDPPEVVPVVTATASSTTVQLSFVLTDEVVRYLKKDSEDSDAVNGDPAAPKIRLILTCSAIIPESVDPYGRYADRRLTTVAADVILSEETTARFSSATLSSSSPPGPWILLLPLLTLLLLAATPPTLPPEKAPTTWYISAPTGATLPHLSALPSTVYSLNHVRPRR